MVRYAKLLLPFDLQKVQSELLSTADEWKLHLNKFHYTGSWKVLSLRSPGGNPQNIVPDLIGESEFLDTIYMEQFPSVKHLLLSMHCPIMAVRFLNLQSRAIIKEHTDTDLAFEKGEARLHFPVFTNPGVEFYCEQDRVFLNEGECWYLNANLPHRVSNNSNEDRIHLVIDCKVNDWLKNMINSSDKIAYKKEEVDDNLLKMIKELRYQNTDASNNLADELEQKVRIILNDNGAI
jgi:hypothetical protein